MKLTLITTFLFLQLTHSTFSQDINSILNHELKADVRSDSAIDNITIINKLFDDPQTKASTKIVVLNSNLMETTLLEYDDNFKMISRYSTQYDASGKRSIVSKFENFSTETGYSSRMEYYGYNDKGNLATITCKNRTDKALKNVDIIYNQEGHPIELLITTTFNNDVPTSNTENSPHRQITEKIQIPSAKLNDSSLVKYNDLGDLVKDGEIEFEYKYDRKSNWIKKTKYIVSNGKKSKLAEVLRTIKYRQS
ncbi:MAG: hypothetical protein ABIQ27_10330 [Flavobacterium sp.]|uniref:hypothetical protein n=1 Tax=Flavobacterium sp. TaxID=239 RepID=UPI003267407F